MDRRGFETVVCVAVLQAHIRTGAECVRIAVFAGEREQPARVRHRAIVCGKAVRLFRRKDREIREANRRERVRKRCPCRCFGQRHLLPIGGVFRLRIVRILHVSFIFPFGMQLRFVAGKRQGVGAEAHIHHRAVRKPVDRVGGRRAVIRGGRFGIRFRRFGQHPGKLRHGRLLHLLGRLLSVRLRVCGTARGVPLRPPFRFVQIRLQHGRYVGFRLRAGQNRGRHGQQRGKHLLGVRMGKLPLARSIDRIHAACRHGYVRVRDHVDLARREAVVPMRRKRHRRRHGRIQSGGRARRGFAGGNGARFGALHSRRHDGQRRG